MDSYYMRDPRLDQARCERDKALDDVKMWKGMAFFAIAVALLEVLVLITIAVW